MSTGLILCDKPAGSTSHDVVARVRRRFGREVRVGHAGTLDPFATGLLIVLVGRATRVQRFVMALPKRYEVVARFGAVSSTGDPEGEITETGVVPRGDLELPTGRIRQRPPAFSAVKVAGRRAYALARAGHAVELPEREVTVRRFEESWRSGDRRGFVVECSSGTYIRSLVADLGDAYCLALRRTRIGPFDVTEVSESLIPLDTGLAFLPAVRLAGDAARSATHGRAIRWREAEMPSGGSRAVTQAADGVDTVEDEEDRVRAVPSVVRLIDEAGLICLAEPRAEAWKPIVGFRGS